MELETVETEAAEKDLFCGWCFKACGKKAGIHGHWQKYGDSKFGKTSWIFLCYPCSHNFWRDYTKCEEFFDTKMRNTDFLPWLEKEMMELKKK